MINGSQRLMVEDYMFHKSYHNATTKWKRWRCSARQKGCKVYAMLDRNEKFVLKVNGRHNHSVPHLEKVNDKFVYFRNTN